MATATVSIVPGQSVGRFALGASLHEVVSIVKEGRDQYPAIDLHYSQADPLGSPVVVSLPENGLRLRFDGPDQRLRLIEILDFSKIKLAYKGNELSKTTEDSTAAARPAFKRVYQIFGASYPGEYIPAKNPSPTGSYVLSWEGVAFTFPLQQSAWSPDKDHVSLLGSHAASPATNLALFEGASWADARNELFTRIPTAARLSALSSKAKDSNSLPAEIEVANIHLGGNVQLVRRSPAPPFTIVLNETTPQDLITELGPADATHKREERLNTPEPVAQRRKGSKAVSSGRGSQPSSYSSTGTDTFDTDFDSGDAEDDNAERSSRETFWCYFTHGFDILVGPPDNTAPSGVTNGAGNTTSISLTHSHLVVKKVVIHGNVPGSYAFNRHRRLRWDISLSASDHRALTSETNFEQSIKPTLVGQFAKSHPGMDMRRGKVVNRTWGGSPSDSNFFLPDAGAAGEDLIEGGGSEQWLGNTRLFAFPGLIFEVLESGAVSALTVC